VLWPIFVYEETQSGLGRLVVAKVFASVIFMKVAIHLVLPTSWSALITGSPYDNAYDH